MVVGCNNLKYNEWISKQDPYVCVEYGSYKSRTCVCKDGGKNPTFQEKFVYNVIEGLGELNISIWNKKTFTNDDFIGSGKIQLAKVLSNGYDDSAWPLKSKTGRHAGEVHLTMHYSTANNQETPYEPLAPLYGASSAQYPQDSSYSRDCTPAY
ncbi:extensin [Artemisia annua]|uniref:Extensin n=1 Tax=Artemisia annua TaxID=35608 RepID=A0A2U1L2S3_ARTAN|nr:extensin [Artemisia annua]